VQAFQSLQLSSNVPLMQVPPWQVFPTVQELLIHPAPSALAGYVHTPSVHVSVVQGSPSLQSIFTPHVPSEHVLPIQQPSAGVQEAVLFVLTQPLTGSQTAASSVHTLPSSQSLAVPTHTPSEHLSPTVHMSPSLQFAVLSAYEHAPVAGSHVSLVQRFWSLHTLASLRL
jgi:hypothetical protein